MGQLLLIKYIFEVGGWWMVVRQIWQKKLNKNVAKNICKPQTQHNLEISIHAGVGPPNKNTHSRGLEYLLIIISMKNKKT